MNFLALRILIVGVVLAGAIILIKKSKCKRKKLLIVLSGIMAFVLLGALSYVKFENMTGGFDSPTEAYLKDGSYWSPKGQIVAEVHGDDSAMLMVYNQDESYSTVFYKKVNDKYLSVGGFQQEEYWLKNSDNMGEDDYVIDGSLYVVGAPETDDYYLCGVISVAEGFTISDTNGSEIIMTPAPEEKKSAFELEWPDDEEEKWRYFIYSFIGEYDDDYRVIANGKEMGFETFAEIMHWE